MDIDHLVVREHEERQRAAQAASAPARAAHAEMADLYRERIAGARASASARAADDAAMSSSTA